MNNLLQAVAILILVHVIPPRAEGATTFSASELAAWWRGEGEGRDSIGENHAIVAGSSTYGAGMVGQVFSNLGSPNNYAFAPESEVLRRPGMSHTLENWIRVEAINSTWIPVTVIKPGIFGVFYNRDEKILRAHVAADRFFHDGRYLDAPFEMPLGAWVHIAQAFDRESGRISLFVNGERLASGSGEMFYWGANGDGPLQIGKGWQPHENWVNFLASFDELTVFSRALSAMEIQSIYNAGENGKVVAPVIASTALPDGMEGKPYAARVRMVGGQSPFGFSIISGSLPAGLSLSADGSISGVPAAPGTSVLRVTATDGSGFSVDGELAFRIEACGLPSLVGDGAWDSSFQRIIAPVGTNGRGSSLAVAQQSGGRTLHATFHHPGYPHPAGLMIKRYDSQGHLDRTFGANGSFFLKNGEGGDGRSMIVQPDDKILLLTLNPAPTHSRFAVYRFNADGSPDMAFGDNGVVFAGITTMDEPRSLLVQPDGKIIAMGSSTRFTAFQDGNFLIMRFNADGSLDSTFGSGGIVETQTGATEWAVAGAVQPDGKLLVLGGAGASQHYGDIGFMFQLIRYHPDGSIDTAFGEEGVSYARFVRYDFPTTVTLQPDGKILVSGWADNSFNFNWIAVARFHPNGELDLCFGDRGKLLAQYFDSRRQNHSSTLSAALQLQGDGKIVVSGVTTIGFENHGDGFLARFHSNGLIDRSFGENGWALGGWLPWGKVAWTGAPFLIQPDGNFLVGHTMAIANLDTPTLARFTGTGICAWTENTAPRAVDDTASTGQHPVDFDVLANDSDFEGDLPTITRVIVDHRAHGTAQMIAPGLIRYTAQPGFDGQAVFQYEIADCPGLTAIATVRVQVSCNCNHAPVAAAQSVQTNEDTPLPIQLSGADEDNHPLTFAVSTQPTHGSITLNADGSAIYIPAEDYFGPDEFAFMVSDGKAPSPPAEVSITISPVNDAPEAANDLASTLEDMAVIIPALQNDSDRDGDTITILSVSQPAHGVAGLSLEGAITYTPHENFFGEDTFTYVITDGNGGHSEATVTINVTPVNDAPLAADDTATTSQATAVTIAVLGNDSDIEGDALSISAHTAASNGVVMVNSDGTITYTPNPGFSGSDSFTYTVTDGWGVYAEATVIVSVAAVELPIAHSHGKVTGGGTIVVPGGKANFAFESLVTGAGRIRGNVMFNSAPENRSFKSLEMTSMQISQDRKTARVGGRGKINGSVIVTFTMEIADLGEPGGGVDRFGIKFSDGYAAAGMLIRPGNIQIHK